MSALSRCLFVATLSASAFALSGCKDSGAAESKSCPRCGTVESILTREVKGEPSAAGTIAGAVVGGVIGHQFGSGKGNQAATAAGAVGGAFAGREVEKDMKKHLVYDVTVRMDSGDTRKLTLSQPPLVHEGDRVEVTGNQIDRVS